MENDQKIIYVFDIENAGIGLEKYGITKDGQLWSRAERKFIEPLKHWGYCYIKETGYEHLIHRLVALTFIPRVEGKNYVNHINSNRMDNRVENLEWVTQKENVNKSDIDTSHPTAVYKLDPKTGEIIGTFASMVEAGKSIGLTRDSISRVCRGKGKTAGGFKWRYVNPPKKEEVDLSSAKPIFGNKKYYIFPNGRVYGTVRKKFLKPTGEIGDEYVTASGIIIQDKPKQKQNCYIRKTLKIHFPGSKVPLEIIREPKAEQRKKKTNTTNTNESSGTKSEEKSPDGSS